jgi:hypothetical protein
VSLVSLQVLVGSIFEDQDSAIDLYLRLVRNGVVFDDDLTLAFGLGVSAQWKYGQFPMRIPRALCSTARPRKIAHR